MRSRGAGSGCNEMASSAMGNDKTNLRILRPSRKRIRPGDVFALQPREQTYLLGRIISTEARIGPMQDVVLLYVYRTRFTSMPDAQRFPHDDLLVSPIMTNRLPWTRGYFENVGHWDLDSADVLDQHCFQDAERGMYFDEFSNELPGPIEPVGDWGLHSYRTIDDEVSSALGIPLAPE